VTALTPAAAILLVGGLANLAFSTLAGFMLYWIRLRDVSVPQPRYAHITHTSATTNGLLLIALSVAVVHSGFSEPVMIGLAVAEVIATMLSDARNVLSWHQRLGDGIADIPETGRRLRGLGNVIHLVVIFALLYGVTRTALGI
jgi:uncharacterized iron-regulated membrane protein